MEDRSSVVFVNFHSRRLRRATNPRPGIRAVGHSRSEASWMQPDDRSPSGSPERYRTKVNLRRPPRPSSGTPR